MAQVTIYFEGEHIFEGVEFEEHSSGDVEFKSYGIEVREPLPEVHKKIMPWHTVRSVELREKRNVG
jgi:hypothetical protein